MKNNIRNLTPNEYGCPLAWPCPAIYEVEESGDKEE